MTNKPQSPNALTACDLCHDATSPTATGPLHIHSKCHITAPLRAEFENGVLSLYCYVPECNRLVGKFVITAAMPTISKPMTPKGGAQ